MRKPAIVAIGALIGALSSFLLLATLGFAVGMASDACADGRPICGNWPFRHLTLFMAAMPLSVLALTAVAASAPATRRGGVVALSASAALAPLAVVMVFCAVARV